MEDIMRDCKCACLGINIFRHLTTVDPRSESGTDDRDEIVWRLLGLIPHSTDINIPSINRNRLSSDRTVSKCIYNKHCSLPLPDIVLSCSSSPSVQPKTSPKECGRHLKFMADEFTNQRSAHKNILEDDIKCELHQKYFGTILQTLFNSFLKFLEFLNR